MPYVSVIIPAYNAADFIVEAYRSITNQTIDDWEIIFSNDGSLDDTLLIMRSLAANDKRVKVVDLTVNSGPACARNAALAIAEGEWIAMLDADDRFSDRRLEVLTRAGERTGADVVLDNQFIVDPISRRTAFLAFEPIGDDVTALDFSKFLQNNQSDAVFDFGYLQPVLRRSWLVANDLKYLETLRHGEDLILLFECYARGAKVILASTPFYHYYFQYSPTHSTISPTSRTEVRYEPLLAATREFLEKYHSTLSPVERQLVTSSCESTREAMTVAELRTSLKNRDLVGLSHCLTHPVRLFRAIYFAKRRSFLWARRIRVFSRTESRLAVGQGR
jgi:succinoglycan biosynthesis protein ExoO